MGQCQWGWVYKDDSDVVCEMHEKSINILADKQTK